MGLDNFWLVPKTTEENLNKFNSEYEQTNYDGEEPDGVEFETAEYQGEHHINLVSGILSSNGNGSFRGKYYSAMCDALTNESGWLYGFHYPGEIEDAFYSMKKHLDKFLSPEGQQHWEEFVSKSRNTVVDHYGCFNDYTIDEAIQFIRMFEYYSTVENICICAWY